MELLLNKGLSSWFAVSQFFFPVSGLEIDFKPLIAGAVRRFRHWRHVIPAQLGGLLIAMHSLVKGAFLQEMR